MTDESRTALPLQTDVERHEERMEARYAQLDAVTTWDGIDLSIMEELISDAV